MLMCNFACRGCSRNDPYCVGWDFEPYSLAHSLTTSVMHGLSGCSRAHDDTDMPPSPAKRRTLVQRFQTISCFVTFCSFMVSAVVLLMEKMNEQFLCAFYHKKVVILENVICSIYRATTYIRHIHCIHKKCHFCFFNNSMKHWLI